jgi:translation initiation factor IF-1
MAKEELIRFEGQVTEVLPNATWRVKLQNDAIILAYLGGKLRKFDINIGMGDRVDIEMSPYDLSRGRIVYRK